ncbi:MAG: Flp pilus assembly protein CpaB [Roseibium sp.]|nr:Flp pilus assembly protein CpaB [Roseibium sp.]
MKYARLVVLGVALGAGVLAARIVMNASAPAPEPVASAPIPVEKTEILVAAKDINLGAKIAGSDMTWAAWPSNAVPRGVVTRQDNAGADEAFAGRIAKAPIYAGEPIRSERLINTDKGFMAAILPKGMRAIAVSVEAETTAGGFILPGDKVDVILTKTDEVRGVVSETILENVRVLAIDGTTAGEQDQKNLSPKRTATLELGLEQSEIVAQAQQLGTIALALRSAQDSSDDAEKTVRRRGVNFVKYGVSSQANAQ